MALNLEKETNRVGPKINTNKIKALSIADHCTFTICIKGHRISSFEQYIYLGSDGKLCFLWRIISAKPTFALLSKIWKYSTVNTEIKLRLFRGICREYIESDHHCYSEVPSYHQPMFASIHRGVGIPTKLIRLSRLKCHNLTLNNFVNNSSFLSNFADLSPILYPVPNFVLLGWT